MTHCSHYYIFSRRMANHVIGEVNRRKAEHRLVYNNKISTKSNKHIFFQPHSIYISLWISLPYQRCFTFDLTSILNLLLYFSFFTVCGRSLKRKSESFINEFDFYYFLPSQTLSFVIQPILHIGNLWKQRSPTFCHHSKCCFE